MSTASFDAPGPVRDLGSGAYRDEDFPGCESFHLPASEMEGGGDPPRADRGANVGDGPAGSGTDRVGDGGARGHDAAARSAHGFRERTGAGKEPRPGLPGGSPRKVTGKAMRKPMRKATWTLWPISSHPGGSS